MTRDEVLKLAREVGIVAIHADGASNWSEEVEVLERFAALVAAAERIKRQSEIQRLTALANTAEKWRGIAMARDGDGRTVQQVQAEARAEEREACAKVCEDIDVERTEYCMSVYEEGEQYKSSVIEAIRARGSHA